MVHQLVKSILLIASLIFIHSFACAQSSSFVVSEIQVLGHRKVEKDAILEKVKIKVGENYNSSRTREDILNIFSLGYFQFVDISTDSNRRLIIEVIEKPSISEIVYEGLEDQKKEDVAEASGLKTYEIYNPTKVKQAVEKIRKFYEEKGFLLAKVDSHSEEIKKDESVKITFKIVENEKVKVKKITFLGNTKLKDGFLKGRMATQEMGYFTGISNSGAYKQDAFERDILILRSLYWNQGYIKVNIDRPQVYVTPDKTSLYITFRIEEGEQYYVGDIDFSGDLLFSRDELMQTTQIKDSEIFAIDIMQKDILDLQAKYGDLGYAFANVNPKYTFDEKEKKVNLVFDFEKGNKVYFGRINVVGNVKTRDKVVRRELKIKEGELYNETRKRQSQENVQRLGYFDELNFKTSVSPDNPDILNLDVAVKERSTGQIQFGAGYGTSAGFTLTGSVTQSNFLGKGQTLSASLDLSDERKVYSFRFTEPYFRDTLWTVGFDVYSSSNTGRVNYDVNKVGASVLFGHPLGEFFKGYFKYRYDKTSLRANEETDPDLFPLDTASGETSSGTFILEYDTRNDRFSPSKGVLSDISYEYAGLGGQLKFSELRLRTQYYKNIFWDVVWRNSLKYSQLQTLVEGRDVPFSELYLMGGPYSLRGYVTSSIGKRKYSNKIRKELDERFPRSTNNEKLAFTPFGGTKEMIYQTEILYPLIKEAGVMGVFFYDVGQAEDEIRADNFASDIGMGIRWFSPLGPLRFEWGWPLNRDPDYHREPVVFEFSIGSPF
jgi:outer membrane protein insertion porin family